MGHKDTCDQFLKWSAEERPPGYWSDPFQSPCSIKNQDGLDGTKHDCRMVTLYLVKGYILKEGAQIGEAISLGLKS